MNSKNNMDELIKFYDELTMENLPRIHEFYSEETFFKDPFHTLTKLSELEDVYVKMFKKLKNPKFVITINFNNGDEAVLFWDFTFNNGFLIQGNSLLKFNAENKIESHIDYWDSVDQIWMKLPVLKQILKPLYKLF
jgi:steroid delta-isomerase